MAPENDWVDEKEAAAILDLSPHTLSRWRWSGKGPAYAKFGKAVRYSKKRHLEPYIDEATRSNTSQTEAA